MKKIIALILALVLVLLLSFAVYAVDDPNPDVIKKDILIAVDDPNPDCWKPIFELA